MLHLISIGILILSLVVWVVVRGYGFYKLYRELDFKDNWENEI